MSEIATSSTTAARDAAPELAAAFDVRGIPALFLFKSGQAHSRLVGLHDEKQLSSWVRAAR
jgi:thioredoxin 1